MKKILPAIILMIALIALTANVSTAQSCGCDYTVGLTTTTIDNNSLHLPAGSVICLTAGTRNGLIVKNFSTNDSTQRFVFKNCGGQVIFHSTQYYGISFRNSKNFVLTGTGTTGVDYGIYVRGYTTSTNPPTYAQQWGIACESLSTDFEIDHVKVSRSNFAGFGLKTDPSCTDSSAWRGHFTMRNVSVHHNRVDTTATGEGLYIGYSFYGSGNPSCPSVMGHAIKGLRVFNNETYYTGAEGIQVGSADEDCQIYNNHVEVYGINPFNGNTAQQGNGIQLGEGTAGSCYNNFIKAQVGATTGGGIKVFGIDNVVYNNIIIDPYELGIFVDERGGSHTGTGSSYRIYNNTIVNSQRDGIVFYSEQVETNKAKNNIIIISNPTTYKYIKTLSGSVPLDSSNNWRLTTANIAGANFQDESTDDYHLTSSSAAVNSGDGSVAAYGVTSDFDGTPRPQQSVFDIGAFEFVAPVEPSDLFINAGGLEVDDSGNTWEADQPNAYLVSGYINYATGSATAFSVPPKTNPTSAPKQVLGSYRYTNHNVSGSNTIKYNIPVANNGDYEVEMFWGLKNSDTGITSGQRRFNIYAEGNFITSYDVYDSAGTGSASSYLFTQSVSDGALELSFVAASGSEAQINAFRVTGPLSGSRMMADSTTSPKVEEKSEIGISPNPASSYIDISGAASDTYSAKIIDLQQRTVGTYEFGSYQAPRIDISHLNNNELYVLQVVSGSGVQRVFKFIKK